MQRRFQSTSFVPPTVPEVEYDPLVEHSLTQNLERDVLVPLLQNIVGGLGVFVAIFAVMQWLIYHGHVNATVTDVVVLGGVAGGFVCGVACAIRAFWDEAKGIAYHWSRGWAVGCTNKRLDWLEDECERLATENRQLSNANAQMVRHVRVTTGQDETPIAPARPLTDEYTEPLRDALALCRFHEAHSTIARERVMAAGMTRARWDAARQLLIDSGTTVNGSAIAEPIVTATAKVREFVEKQRRAPAGFVMPNEG